HQDAPHHGPGFGGFHLRSNPGPELTGKKVKAAEKQGTREFRMNQPERVPSQAWLVTFAGTAINLCLGILYAWSVWKASLIATADHPPGTPMTGLNEGWTYLTNAEATWAYALCGLIFALFMIPGGRLQDRYGPKLGA